MEVAIYGTKMYAKCLDDITKLMIKRGIEAIVLILVKARDPFRASTSLAQIIRVEVLDVVLAVSEVRK